MSDDSDSHRFLMRGLLHSFYWCDEGLQNCLRAAGLQGISRTKSMIMVNIADGVTRASDLARVMGISRQATHQTLVEMERDGLVTLVPDPRDGRAKIVNFSRHGATVGKAAFDAMARVEAELRRRLGPAAVLALKDIVFSDWGPVVDPAGDEPAAGAGVLPRRRVGGGERRQGREGDEGETWPAHLTSLPASSGSSAPATPRSPCGG